MSQYFNDFSQYAGAEVPADFTSRWDTANTTYSVVADAGVTGGKFLRVTRGATGRGLVTWDAIDADPNTDNIEVLIRYRAGLITDTGGGMSFRASGASGAETAYNLHLRDTSLELSRYVAGGNLFVQSVAKSNVANTWYYLRGRANGTTISIKSWSGTLADEPVGWEQIPTNSDVTGTGWAGIFAFRNTDHDVDFIGIGTNGEAAPQSAPSTTPVITDINTNNEVVPGTTATVTGTLLTGTTGVTIDGVAQTAVTVVNDTTVTFTVVRGGNPYNQGLTAELTTADGTDSITVQQTPETGTFAVTAMNPNTTDTSSLWTGLIDTVTSNPITIVNGDQAWVKNPNNLTNLAVDPDGRISADITGDFVVQIWLASEGVWGSDQTVTFEELAPTGTVSLGTVSVTETTADLPFTYSGTDTPSFEYRLNDGVWGAWITVTSPIQITGLTAGTQYTVEVRAFNTGGTSNTASVVFTTDAVPVVAPVGTITFGTISVTDDTADIPFSYSDTDQAGFEYRLDNEVSWTRTAASPINLLVLQPNTTYTLHVRAYNSAGTGAINSIGFKTLEQAVGPPQGKIVFAVPTRGSDLIVQQFFYEEGDASYYEYKIDAGTWTVIPFGPIGLQDLTASTSYTISVRPVNAEGTGDTATTTVSTRAEADIIQRKGIKR